WWPRCSRPYVPTSRGDSRYPGAAVGSTGAGRTRVGGPQLVGGLRRAARTVVASPLERLEAPVLVGNRVLQLVDRGRHLGVECILVDRVGPHSAQQQTAAQP